MADKSEVDKIDIDEYVQKWITYQLAKLAIEIDKEVMRVLTDDNRR
jgi:hypothetical protein